MIMIMILVVEGRWPFTGWESTSGQGVSMHGMGPNGPTNSKGSLFIFSFCGPFIVSGGPGEKMQGRERHFQKP